jgi:hypothetical protein
LLRNPIRRGLSPILAVEPYDDDDDDDCDYDDDDDDDDILAE